MKSSSTSFNEQIANISPELWKPVLEEASSRYHILAAWIGIIFDPLFAFTDYINIPDKWQQLLLLRLSISVITLTALLLRTKLKLSSTLIVLIPFTLISLQNAYTYRLIGDGNLLGHNLNYMALLIAGALFIMWEVKYSIAVIALSLATTLTFIFTNQYIEINMLILKGGWLLAASAIFMIVLIKTRYNLTVKEIKARLALQQSNNEIQTQAEEIKMINENLEHLVKQRTLELEKKNAALEEAAFINAHKLRSPVASILGLTNLLIKTELTPESKVITEHLDGSVKKLDEIVSSISRTIEESEK